LTNFLRKRHFSPNFGHFWAFVYFENEACHRLWTDPRLQSGDEISDNNEVAQNVVNAFINVFEKLNKEIFFN